MALPPAPFTHDEFDYNWRQWLNELQQTVTRTGVWTPAISDSTSNATSGGVTYSLQYGRWSRVNDIVFISGRLTLASLGTLGAGVTVYLWELPFTSAADQDSGSFNVGFASNLTITASESVTGFFPLGSDYVELQQWSLAGGTDSLTQTELTATTNITFSGFYFTDEP